MTKNFMRFLYLHLLGAACFVWALVLPNPAQAGPYTCSISSAPGFTLIYNPLDATTLSAIGSVTLNCAKTGNNSDTLYYELGSDGGVNLSGGQSRVLSGANAINYGLWRDSTHTLTWTDLSANRIKGSVSGTATTSVTVNYYMLFPARQNATVANDYADTLTVKLYQGATSAAASVAITFVYATVAVAVTVPAHCLLSSPPGNILLIYTSFQTSPSAANTSFAATCVSGVSYTMALDASAGTLLGLAYSLALSKTGQQTGTGLAQNVTINASMAAGQAGICSTGSCTASEPRTLTITY